MKIKWGSIWLADDAFPAYGVAVNGRQIIQEAQFIRAAQSSFFSRHNRSLTLGFSTSRSFPTIRAAELFRLGHHGSLPDTAMLSLTCGLPSETPQVVTIGDACLESVDFPANGHKGVSLDLAYVIKASGVTGIASEEPATPQDFVLSGSIALPSGINSFSVTGRGFLSTPTRVIASISRPADGAMLFPNVIAASIDTDGFDVELGGTVPGGGYFLDYFAVLT